MPEAAFLKVKVLKKPFLESQLSVQGLFAPVRFIVVWHFSEFIGFEIAQIRSL